MTNSHRSDCAHSRVHKTEGSGHSSKLSQSTLTNSRVNNSGLRQATWELVVISMWILEVPELLGGRGGQAPGRKEVQHRRIQILWTFLLFSLQPILKKLCFRSFREHWKLALSKTRACLDAYPFCQEQFIGGLAHLLLGPAGPSVHLAGSTEVSGGIIGIHCPGSPHWIPDPWRNTLVERTR